MKHCFYKSVTALEHKDLMQRLYNAKNNAEKTRILERFFGNEIDTTADKIFYTKKETGKTVLFVLIKNYRKLWRESRVNRGWERNQA